MSMKQELEQWVTALAHYDKNEFEESIRAFQPIADTSKILFNCGVIRATLGEHEAAVQYYHRAVNLDQYLAVAYFQAGVSHFLVGDFEEALANFNDTLLYLRGNNNIDYDQLGLKFKLYSCEALFNRGLCYVYLQQTDTGLQDMVNAKKEKVISEHEVIDDAINDKAEGYTVFSIPVGMIFRPSEAKVKNVRARDYLGKPQLIRANTGEQVSHRRNLSADVWAKDDRPPEKLSFAATNLVRPGLHSRTRLQSEPPISRNVFPPTPPPESEKPAPLRTGQAAVEAQRAPAGNPPKRVSTEPDGPVAGHVPAPRSNSASRAPRPEKLTLGVAAFEQPSQRDNTRRMPARSASERPAERLPMDAEPRRRPSREQLFGAVQSDESAEDVGARLYQEHARSSSNRRRPSGRQQPHQPRASRHQLIKEEDEDLEEVIADSPSVRESTSSGPSLYHTPGQRRPSATRNVSTRSNPVTSLRTIRVKVHFGEDTRYIIVAPGTKYREFVELVCRKFAAGVIGGKSGTVKIRIKDEEGDLITMGDQDDWDMSVDLCRSRAKKEESDMGKMEVWAQEVP